MPIHSEADKASKEVKKAGTMTVLQALWFERRWRKQKREIMKTQFVGSVWPQDSFAALTVGRWSPRWTIHFIPTMRRQTPLDTTYLVFFKNLVGILFSFYFSGIVLSMENHERAILVTTTGECLAKRSRLPKNCKRLWTRAMRLWTRAMSIGLQPIREFLGISRCWDVEDQRSLVLCSGGSSWHFWRRQMPLRQTNLVEISDLRVLCFGSVFCFLVQSFTPSLIHTSFFTS